MDVVPVPSIAPAPPVVPAPQTEFLEGLLSLLLLEVPLWAIQLQKLLMPMRKQAIQMSKDLQAIREFHQWAPLTRQSRLDGNALAHDSF
eukprot:g32898.t1